MVQYIGMASVSSPRTEDTYWELPDFAQPGDLLVAAHFGTRRGKAPGPGWSFISGQDWRDVYSIGSDGWATEWWYTYLRVYSITVTEAMVQRGVLLTGRSYNQRSQFTMVVLRGTAGVGSYSRGRSPALNVRPHGGVLAIQRDLSGVAGATDLTLFHERSSWQVQLGFGFGSSDTGGVLSAGKTRGGLAIELLPPAGPLPPKIDSPATGSEVSYLDPLHVSWAHQPSVLGGTQDAYRLRIRRAGTGTWEYWSTALGGLTTSESTNLTTLTWLDIPADLLDPEQSYEIQVQTRESQDGTWSGWSALTVVTRVVPPTVWIDEVLSPHGTLSPTVRWSSNTGDREQVAYQVQVLRGGAILYDSGTVSSADAEALLPRLDWDNGASYTVRVRIVQTGGASSEWDEATFTVSWTEPELPVVQVDPTSPGMRVRVTDSALAQARATLEAVLGEEPVYSPDAPADLSRAWYSAGEVRRWVDYGPGPVTNLVTNPRGRRTSGTVVVREDVPAAEAVLYEDPETSPDPDLSVEWQGVPGGSDADLVAPKPVGWETLFGSIYYSESRDALALLPNPDSGNVYLLGDTDVSPPTPFTRVFTLWTDTGNSVELVVSSQGLVTVNDGETLHTVFETSATGFLSLFAVDGESPVNTIYIRAAVAPGEYSGPYFDGHAFGVYWDGDPDNSTSTYPGPQWALVEDGAVQDAAWALSQVGTAGTVEIQRIGEGAWQVVHAAAPLDGGEVVLQDVLAPFGEGLSYRARLTYDVDGQLMRTGWTDPTEPRFSNDTNCYLVNGEDPLDFMLVHLASDGVRTRVQDVAVSYGQGDARPMVDYAEYQGLQGSLSLLTLDHEELDALIEYLNSPRALALRQPPEGGRDGGVLRFAVSSRQTISRVLQSTDSSRIVTFDWVEQ